MKTAVIAGATGLIGNQLLHLLLNDARYNKVKVLARKPIEIQHSKLEVIIVNFDNLSQYKDQLASDDVFCCLGTTMKQAKSKEAFKKVDLDYPFEIARLTKEQGATQYLLISALGADKNSGIYYNKIKGETEEVVAKVNFQALHIFRPSLLLGERNESRSGEDAAKVFYKLFGFLIPKKYKGIEAATVARAMLFFAKEEKPGIQIHESIELQQY
jgi:uncharacterized protein YbjT (DUF2867 family)